MNTFKKLKIKGGRLQGDRISIYDVIGKPIVIENFRLAKSKYPKPHSDKFLIMQIRVGKQSRILMSGSASLMQTMMQVRRSDLPIKTEIIQIDNSFTFKQDDMKQVFWSVIVMGLFASLIWGLGAFFEKRGILSEGLQPLVYVVPIMAALGFLI